MNQKQQINTQGKGLPWQVVDLAVCDASVFQVNLKKKSLSLSEKNDLKYAV